ncbi:sulfotransferase family protein [Paracoccus aerius]|nr:sulfotransferase [Paracoccus aerius]
MMPDDTQKPIAIGAIGGSGSRVLAKIIQASGVSIGSNLNPSSDNLEFTARFKTLDVLDLPDNQFFSRLGDFEAISRADMVQAGNKRWGWKEPNTHVVIERILEAYPSMRYVHLLRNGFDMAFSGNQNQPRLWGPAYLNRPISDPPTPPESLAYFCEVHRRISKLARQPHNQSRILFVEYEALCYDPKSEITRLLDFLDFKPEVSLKELCNAVQQPASIGRSLAFGLKPFDQEDLNYIRKNLPKMLPAS